MAGNGWNNNRIYGKGRNNYCYIFVLHRRNCVNINTYHFVEGAKKARGVAVIIDVFRAFSVECYLSHNNAKAIIPVGAKEIAYALKEKHPEYLLVGERHGVMLEGFDYGNSPSKMENVDFSGKTVVHTTSAGTQGLDNAVNADCVLTGSLVNAKAIARFIKQSGFSEVTLVPMGLEALCETEEDTLCAYYIENLLKGNDIDIAKEVEKLRTTSAKKFFDDNYPQFPARDFELCTQVNKFSFVLKVHRDGNMMRVERVNV